MKKKLFTAVLAVVAAGILLGSYAAAQGYGANASEQKPVCEKCQLLRQAIYDGDYVAWKELVQGTKRGDRLLKAINESNFGGYSQVTRNMIEGMEQYGSFMKELGLKPRDGLHRGLIRNWVKERMRHGKGWNAEEDGLMGA